MPDKRHTTFGFDELIKNINTAFESSFTEAGQQVLTDAKYLSSDVPSISGSLQLVKQDKGFKVESSAGVYSAYLEFGTGNHAAVLVPGLPEDWQAMAKKYYINGKGTLPAQPYLYPAFQKMKVNIESIIVKKIG